MRSRREYIITKDEVHGYANHWLDKSLKLEYEGTKCTASTLLQILLIAAACTVSIFAASAIWQIRLPIKRFAMFWRRRCQIFRNSGSG